MAFERVFRFELFTAQITQVMPLCVVSVHVSLQVTPTAACVVAQVADEGLHTYKHKCAQKVNYMRKPKASKKQKLKYIRV